MSSEGRDGLKALPWAMPNEPRTWGRREAAGAAEPVAGDPAASVAGCWEAKLSRASKHIKKYRYSHIQPISMPMSCDFYHFLSISAHVLRILRGSWLHTRLGQPPQHGRRLFALARELMAPAPGF